MRVVRGIYLLLCLAMAGVCCHSGVDIRRSNRFGVLLNCEQLENGVDVCWWNGINGTRVQSRDILTHYTRYYNINLELPLIQNINQHISYLEGIQKYSNSLNHTFSYDIGLGQYSWESFEPSLNVTAIVHSNIEAMNDIVVRKLANTPDSLNWCSTNNPLGKSVCTAIKSQEKCGSCWAFAASDAIETAVGISSNGNNITSISPQQFLDCSTNKGQHKFDFSWIKGKKEIPTWLKESMNIRSHNQGCNGGTTHLAFEYASRAGIASELDYPYEEGSSTPTNAIRKECRASTKKPYAYITSWKSVTAADSTKDFHTALINKLQEQSIAVTIHASTEFRNGYVGGIYSCPNNGNIANFEALNHALVLVGYAHDKQGLYWILKNSYGSKWANDGFLHLRADSKLNCGLNVFPVVPLGASSKGSVTVDGGGKVNFLGASMITWVIIGSVIAVITVISVVVGYISSNRRRKQEFHI